jgi:type II secretory pathway pseudopilin PulG
MRIGERGFTYVAWLWAVALAGALLAAAATAWSGRAERADEREWLFRGAQVALALERWQAAVPGAPGPQRLEDLLLDTRLSPPQRHLRRLWADPASGQADWLLERDAAGGIVGVRSRSERPQRLLSMADPAARAATVSDSGPPRWRDRVFGAGAPAAAAPSAPPTPRRPRLKEAPLGIPERTAVVPTDQAWPPPSRGSVKPAS